MRKELQLHHIVLNFGFIIALSLSTNLQKKILKMLEGSLIEIFLPSSLSFEHFYFSSFPFFFFSFLFLFTNKSSTFIQSQF